MKTWVWHARENSVVVDTEAMLVSMYNLENFKIVKMFLSILLWKRKVLKLVFPFERRILVDFCMWVHDEIVASKVERGVFKVIYTKMPLTKLSLKYVHVLLKVLAFQLFHIQSCTQISGSWLVRLHNHILHSFISSITMASLLHHDPTRQTAGEASLPSDPATRCPAKWS